MLVQDLLLPELEQTVLKMHLRMLIQEQKVQKLELQKLKLELMVLKHLKIPKLGQKSRLKQELQLDSRQLKQWYSQKHLM